MVTYLHVYYAPTGFGTRGVEFWGVLAQLPLPPLASQCSLFSSLWLLGGTALVLVAPILASIDHVTLQSPYFITLCCFLAFQVMVPVSLG